MFAVFVAGIAALSMKQGLRSCMRISTHARFPNKDQIFLIESQAVLLHFLNYKSNKIILAFQGGTTSPIQSFILVFLNGVEMSKSGTFIVQGRILLSRSE